MVRPPLTAQDFYRYYQCPLWPYWERFGDSKDRRPLSAVEEERIADGLEHEAHIVSEFFPSAQKVAVESPQKGFEETLRLMQKGVAIIYQGWLMDGNWLGRPDLLEKQPGKSLLGEFYYLPVDVKRAHCLKKEHKAQLTFYALLLEKIQGVFPGHPAIVNGDGARLAFAAEDFLPEFREVLAALERIRMGELPELTFRKTSVDTSPWGRATERLLVERDDIALLYNIDLKKLRALRGLGVATVEAAALLDPWALEGRASGLTLRALEAIKRQAESLRHKSVIIREPFPEIEGEAEIHFDIESHPPTDRDYLYGIWQGDCASGEYRSFVAERPEDEEKMWRSFVAWLSTLPEKYTVFHYAPYEITRVRLLAERYGDATNPHLEKFINRMRDLKEMVREHAVFPVYFYSLKTINKFLGFRWEGDVLSGGDSILAYDRWLETGERSHLEGIIRYNSFDVRATAHLLKWLRAYAAKPKIYTPPYPWV